MESLTSGTMAGTGSFRCRSCGYLLTLTGTDTLSDCPGCGGQDFARASLFSRESPARDRADGAAIAGEPGAPGARGRIVAGHGNAGARAAGSAGSAGTAGAPRAGARRASDDADTDTLNTGRVGDVRSQPESDDSDAWLRDAREQLPREPGEYLAYEDGDELKVVALTREWTRIGRSLAADVRFDDPTVSRRHALVVRQADGVRVLDDRSLNGVFVNGARIDRSGVGQQVLKDGDEILVGRYRLRFLRVAPDAGTAPPASGALHGAG